VAADVNAWKNSKNIFRYHVLIFLTHQIFLEQNLFYTALGLRKASKIIYGEPNVNCGRAVGGSLSAVLTHRQGWLQPRAPDFKGSQKCFESFKNQL